MMRSYFIGSMIGVVLLSACANDETPSPKSPAPDLTRKPFAAELVEKTTKMPPWKLLGLKSNDPLVKEFISQANSEPVYDEVAGYGTFITLAQDGIELSADLEHNITTLVIYGQTVDPYARYTGALPQKLSWDMTRGDVEEMFGKPAKVSLTLNPNTQRQELFAEYPALGLYMNFAAQSEEDLHAKFIDIRMKLVE